MDGQSKEDSVQIITDGQTASLTIEYGTINLTYDNSLRGNTITCTIGSKTITKIAPNNANAMVFYPPITGNWAITTQVGESIVASTPNPVVVSSLSTPVSASIQGLATITVTLYGAVEDTISFTDENGVTKTETFATGQSSKQVSITVLPSGSSITFTSSVAKNPSNLSEDYTKTVTVTSNTTEVKCCPDGALYWYGYLPYQYTVKMDAGGDSVAKVTFNTRNVTLWGSVNSSTNYNYAAVYFNAQATDKTYLKAILTSASGYDKNLGVNSAYPPLNYYITSKTAISGTGVNSHTIGANTSYYPAINVGGGTLVVSAMWLE